MKDELAQHHVFSHLTGPSVHGDPFARDPSTVEADIVVRFPSGPTAAASARAAVCTLEPQLETGPLDDLRLLVSELVTNSVRHSESLAVRMRIRLSPDLVRVEVFDAGRGFVPAPRSAGPTTPGGWGLYLVDRLADRWGVAREGVTSVWFELDRGARAEQLAATG